MGADGEKARGASAVLDVDVEAALEELGHHPNLGLFEDTINTRNRGLLPYPPSILPPIRAGFQALRLLLF